MKSITTILFIVVLLVFNAQQIQAGGPSCAKKHTLCDNEGWDYHDGNCCEGLFCVNTKAITPAGKITPVSECRPKLKKDEEDGSKRILDMMDDLIGKW